VGGTDVRVPREQLSLVKSGDVKKTDSPNIPGGGNTGNKKKRRVLKGINVVSAGSLFMPGKKGIEKIPKITKKIQ